LSQGEARALSADHVGTGHILLGILAVSDGTAARYLDSLGISLEGARNRVALENEGQPPQAPQGHIPFDDGAKAALESALREALELNHTHIGTEHLLLGVIRDSDGVGAQVLVSLGADLTAVREQIIELASRPEDE